MRSTCFASLLRGVAITWLFAATGFAQVEQVKQRIAVFPFDDRTTANKDMSIGTKVSDLLIAKLTANGAFTVYDRQYVDRILAEKDRKYDPNYDSAAATKSSLLGTVDMVISGQIDAFNANATQVTSGKFLMKTVETDGSVVLKVTARLISVERGSVITAPIANTEQKGVLAKADTVAPLVTNHLPGSRSGLDVNQQQTTSNTDQALRKLVDQAADQVTKQLAEQVAQSAASIPKVPLSVAATPTNSDPHPPTTEIRAAFVGISGGLAYIDKGSQAGVKIGQKFSIRRSIDTGLKNGAGEPILRHKPLCTLVISSVEESSAAGKCVPDTTAHGPDGVPHAGDDVIMATK
jgi:curli biogenesis system outer membrane secretion channel CsgG